MSKDLLAEMKIELQMEGEQKISFHKASLLHGVLMQHISEGYAETLHMQGLKPYSQCVCRENDKNIWYIRTFTEEAYQQIIIPLMDVAFSDFYLEHEEKKVTITHREVKTRLKEELFEEFYESKSERLLTIYFKTPTSFKKDGRYYFFPDIRNIYGSLIRKYDAASVDEEMMNEDTLEQLCESSSVTAYQLNSVNFPLEGVRIPAYMGYITIRISGPQTMVNYAKLLLQFGCYCGVGIKTALGMGSISVQEGRRERKKYDREGS